MGKVTGFLSDITAARVERDERHASPKPEFSGYDDITLRAIHVMLDGWGVRRFGNNKPYAAKLQQRLMWAAANGFVNIDGVHRYEQVSNE